MALLAKKKKAADMQKHMKESNVPFPVFPSVPPQPAANCKALGCVDLVAAEEIHPTLTSAQDLPS